MLDHGVNDQTLPSLGEFPDFCPKCGAAYDPFRPRKDAVNPCT
jgi:hypothetical protein